MDTEKFEELPTREKSHSNSCGRSLPWARLNRWIESHKGVHVDLVFHEFVNLKWLLPEYRTKEQFRRHIELDTFWENGKICYHDDYWARWKGNSSHPIEESASKEVYVHPTTRLVCVFYPKTPKSWKSREREEFNKKCRIIGHYHQLCKKDGIWYEVKAEVLPKGRLSFLHKKPDENLLEPDASGIKYLVRPGIMITLKRQLSSKELKKNGLTNG